MTEPDPTHKPRRRYPRRKPAPRLADADSTGAALQEEIDIMRASILKMSNLAEEEQVPAKKAYIYDVMGKQATRLKGLEMAKRRHEEEQDQDARVNEAIAIARKYMEENGCHE
jgi:hypothetical protein